MVESNRIKRVLFEHLMEGFATTTHTQETAIISTVYW